jgi:hypothetical protein
MPFLRPTGNISVGNWTGVAPLYSNIDEASPSDIDYISSGPSPSGDYSEFGISPTGVPINRNNHYIRYRIQKNISTTTQLDVTATLYQQNIPIASGTHVDIPTGFYTTGFLLTNAQASAITNYSGLSIRLTASTQSSGNYLVDQMNFYLSDETDKYLVS